MQNHRQNKATKSSRYKRQSVLIRSLTYLGATMIGLALLTFLALNLFIAWLNTSNGGDWLATQLNQQISTQGYSIEVASFSLSGLSGIEAQTLILKQDDQILLSMRDTALSFSPTALIARNLTLDITAEELHIQNRPVSEKNTETSPEVTPITLPDLAMDDIHLDAQINRLIISETIIKGGLDIGVNTEQHITLEGQNVTITGEISAQYSDAQLAPQIYYPSELNHTLTIDLSTLSITFEAEAARTNQYDLTAKGLYRHSDQFIQASVNGEWLNGDILPPEIQTPVALNLAIEGPLQDLIGQINIETAYKGEEFTLSTTIRSNDQTLLLSNLSGQSAPLTINGDLAYHLDTTLVTGDLDFAIADLTLITNFIDGVDQVEGAAQGRVTLSASPQNTQAAAASIDLATLQWQDIRVDAATMNVTLPDIKTPDIKKIDDYNATIDATAVNYNDQQIDSLSLAVSPSENGQAYDISLSGKHLEAFTLESQGVLKSTEPLAVDIASFTANFGKNRITGAGNLTGETVTFDIQSEAFNLGDLTFIDTKDLPPIRVERFAVSLRNTLSSPVITLDYRIRPTIPKDGLSAVFNGQTTYQDQTLQLTLSGEGTGIDQMALAASMPLSISLQPFAFAFDDNAAVNGTVNANANIGTLTALFLDQGYTVDGLLALDGELSGTLKKPSLAGDLAFRDGRLIDDYNDIQFVNVTADARLQDRRLTLENMTAKDSTQKGTLSASGFIGVTDITNPEIDLALALKNLHAMKNQNFDAWLDADLAMKGKNADYVITGEFRPVEINITIPDQFVENIPALNIVEEEQAKGPMDDFYNNLKLDLAFSAENNIFLSGRGLNAEAAGKLNITGNLDAPNIDGKLNTIRGEYTEFGRVFDLEKAELNFRGRTPPSPYLDVTAATEVDDIMAKVNITGAFQSPKIGFSATPALPEDEVLSLILFGSNIEDISPFQAIQLADTIRRFSGQGNGEGFNPVQKLRQTVGLDNLTVEGVGTDSTTVGAGKYLTDKVYIEVEQGTGEAATSAASIEVELTPDITLESKAAQNGESDIGLFWEWDY